MMSRSAERTQDNVTLEAGASCVCGALPTKLRLRRDNEQLRRTLSAIPNFVDEFRRTVMEIVRPYTGEDVERAQNSPVLVIVESPTEELLAALSPVVSAQESDSFEAELSIQSENEPTRRATRSATRGLLTVPAVNVPNTTPASENQKSDERKMFREMISRVICTMCTESELQMAAAKKEAGDNELSKIELVDLGDYKMRMFEANELAHKIQKSEKARSIYDKFTKDFAKMRHFVDEHIKSCGHHGNYISLRAEVDTLRHAGGGLHIPEPLNLSIKAIRKGNTKNRIDLLEKK